jgi:hypothetical protein
LALYWYLTYLNARDYLRGAEFKEKRRLIELFDVKVYPSDDLKNVRVRCGAGNDEANGQGQTGECVKVLFAPPEGTRTISRIIFESPGVN